MDDDQTHTRAVDPNLVQEPLTSATAGTILCGRYQLGQLIGSGGMAQVWSATDTVLGRQVAIKMLHPHLSNDTTFVARFRAEAIAAARLSHPNIVGVFDTCSDAGREAIVMELLSATTLRQHLDTHHTIEVATTVRIALRVLSALEAAHQAGLVHRDVKPSNILLCDDGRVKIADFGIVKIDGQTDLTQAGALVGSVAYLAPEQVADEPVDGRADLYALAIVMYECLTGATPFKGDTKAAVAVKRLHAKPTDPRRLRTGIPPELARTIMKALERYPEDRFDSAADLRAALLNGPVEQAIPESLVTEDTGELPAPADSFSRSERRWLYPAVLLILVAIALTTAGLLLAESARDLGGHRTTTSLPSSTPAVIPLRITQAVPFDPQGDGHENDSGARQAIDGDPESAWRTEGYDPPGFSRGKTGVGLALHLESRSLVDKVSIEGSTNDWSGRVFIIDSDSIDDFNPNSAEAVGSIDSFDAPQSVQLVGSTQLRTGTVVLIWITDLGVPGDDGRHRVSLSSVQISGSPVT